MAALFGGELAAAAQALLRAAEHLPRHVGTWHALGWCRILRTELGAAEASLRKACELERSFGETHGALAVLEILRGAGSRARCRADTALRLSPNLLAGRYAKVLIEAQGERARRDGVRAILASERTLGGGTLLELVGRQAARGRNPT